MTQCDCCPARGTHVPESQKRKRGRTRAAGKGLSVLDVDRMFDLVVDETFKLRPPDVLYHYTMWQGAEGILTGQHFRATAHDCTNDPAELATAADVIVGVARELRRDSTGLAGSVLDLFLESYSHLQLGGIMKVYLVCFSAARDDPQQWRRYGDSGRGVCLGIRVLDEPGPRNRESGSALVRVDYSEASWHDSVKSGFTQVLSLLGRAESTRANFELALNALLRIAAFASIAAKQPQWAPEQEFRYVTILHKDSTIAPKIRDTNGKAIPYLETVVRADGKRIALAEIIIGANQDPEAAALRLRAVLAEAGYSPGDMEYPSIVVSNHQLP